MRKPGAEEGGGVSDPDPVQEITDRLGAAADRLADLSEVPVGGHVERYDALHTELQDALAAIDEV